MEEEHLISVILSIIIAFMGWLMQRKTERIKIMENQLSEKKYKAYADMNCTPKVRHKTFGVHYV